MAENDNESSSDQAITWASLIPDFFYDLIGRVIPGCLFIIGLVYMPDKEIIFKPEPPYTIIFILLLGASYAAGLILTVIGDLLCRIFKTSQFKFFLTEFNLYNYIKGLVTLSTELTTKSVEDLNRKDCEILFQIQHDYVKKNYSPQARSLSKSAAEVQLCINTSVAFSLIALVSVISGKPWGIWVIFSSIAIVSFFAALYRNKRFLLRQFSFSAAIKKREGK